MKRIALAVILIVLLPSKIFAVAQELPAPAIDDTTENIQVSWEELAGAKKYIVEITECLECGPFGTNKEVTSPFTTLTLPKSLSEVWLIVRAIDANSNVIGSYTHVQIVNKYYSSSVPMAANNSNIAPAPTLTTTPRMTTTTSVSAISKTVVASQTTAADVLLPIIVVSVVIILILFVIFAVLRRRVAE